MSLPGVAFGALPNVWRRPASTMDCGRVALRHLFSAHRGSTHSACHPALPQMVWGMGSAPHAPSPPDHWAARFVHRSAPLTWCGVWAVLPTRHPPLIIGPPASSSDPPLPRGVEYGRALPCTLPLASDHRAARCAYRRSVPPGVWSMAGRFATRFPTTIDHQLRAPPSHSLGVWGMAGRVAPCHTPPILISPSPQKGRGGRGSGVCPTMGLSPSSRGTGASAPEDNSFHPLSPRRGEGAGGEGFPQPYDATPSMTAGSSSLRPAPVNWL